MRIGLEMFGTQTAGRGRGIGRYCRNLAAALVARGGAAGHELVFYAADAPGLSTDLIPRAPNAALRLLRPEPDLGHALNRLATTNPDGLDALVFVNPLEMTPGTDIPARPASGLALAAVVHDLIPLLFADDYLGRWPAAFRRRYLWSLERLRTYDRLLANSEATRADVLRVLDPPADRVVTVGAAGDDRGLAFTPDPDDPADLAAVRALGVTGAFILTVAGPDPHKNLGGLFDAFARLPSTVRAGHALVVAAGSSDPGRAAVVRGWAEERGVLSDLVLLDRPVDDRALRALYRRCAAFAFPSRYEGFGLPVLEALGCGAAVVAGSTSSLPEVAGDAARLVDPADPSALAGALAAVLTDPALARSLRARGPARARLFSWDAVADRVLGALAEVVERPTRAPRPAVALPRRPDAAPRPRVAFVSPLPPDPSGVADYAAALVDALADHAALDLFHDAGAFPAARFRRRGFGCFDHRLFDRLDRVRPYDAVVYQMGNSPAHVFVEGLLRRRPGIVVLHDLALASYYYERATRHGGGRDAFRRALDESHPDRAGGFEGALARWSADPAGMVRALTDAGLDMNGGIVAAARAVIVHSRAAAERLGPAAAGKTFVVPHGAEPAPAPPSAAERAAARGRLGLPAGALVVGNLGIVHPTKRNAEVVEAFAAVARSVPDSLLLVVGAEADGGLARRRAGELGLAGRVRFAGRLGDDRFLDAVVAADVGVALRRPPTNGESSGALLHLLRRGVPAVVSDTGSFAEYPDGAVRKVPPDRGAAGVAAALLDLAADPAARAALGRAGLEHVRAVHAWPLVAAQYAGVIARSARGDVRADAAAWFRGPHPHRAGAGQGRAARERGEPLKRLLKPFWRLTRPLRARLAAARNPPPGRVLADHLARAEARADEVALVLDALVAEQFRLQEQVEGLEHRLRDALAARGDGGRR